MLIGIWDSIVCNKEKCIKRFQEWWHAFTFTLNINMSESVIIQHADMFNESNGLGVIVAMNVPDMDKYIWKVH